MTPNSTTIDQDTKVPISLIIVLISAFLAGAGFLFNLSGEVATVKASIRGHEVIDDKRVEMIERKQDRTSEVMQSIDNRLSRIEGALGVKK